MYYVAEQTVEVKTEEVQKKKRMDLTYGHVKLYVAGKTVRVEFPGSVYVVRKFKNPEDKDRFVRAIKEIVDAFNLGEVRDGGKQGRASIQVIELKTPYAGWGILAAVVALSGIRRDYFDRWVNAFKAMTPEEFERVANAVASMYGGDFTNLPSKESNGRRIVRMRDIRSTIGRMVRRLVAGYACSHGQCPSRRRRSSALENFDLVAEKLLEAARRIDKEKIIVGGKPKMSLFYEELAKAAYEVYKEAPDDVKPKIKALINSRSGAPKSPSSIARLWRMVVDAKKEEAERVLTELGFPREFVELYSTKDPAERLRKLREMGYARGGGRSTYYIPEDELVKAAEEVRASGARFASEREFARLVAEKLIKYKPPEKPMRNWIDAVLRRLRKIYGTQIKQWVEQQRPAQAVAAPRVEEVSPVVELVRELQA